MVDLIYEDIFQWDIVKNRSNIAKHKIAFHEAVKVFDDPYRIFERDPKHSSNENRWFCYGKVEKQVLTVRFTVRKEYLRIIGAGYWRKGEKIYEKENRSKIR